MTNYDEPTVIEKLLAEKKAKVKTFTVDEVIAMLTNIQIEIQENQECANPDNWNNYLFSGCYDNGLDTSCDIIQEKINSLKEDTNQ